MDRSVKSDYVRAMFSSIAPRYDLLNRLLSFGRDIYWRREAVREFPLNQGGEFLDVATGTGDVAISMIEGSSNPMVRVVGVDFSEAMLDLGRKKLDQKGLNDRIELGQGDATALSFEDNRFQGSVSAFGLRNFSGLKEGLKEMLRVVAPGGKVVILEFTNPTNPILKWIYYSYFRYLLPLIGGLVSGNREAYQYLPDSVLTFPSARGLKDIMEECGMGNVRVRLMTFGIVALHVGEKV